MAGNRRARAAPVEREPTPPLDANDVDDIDFGSDEEAIILHGKHIDDGKEIELPVRADSAFLRRHDMLEEARRLLSVAGLDCLIDHEWGRCDRYVYEVIASVRCNPTAGRLHEVSFRIGGQSRTLTHSELCAIFGFPENGTIPRYNELERHEFWETIAAPGTYYYPSVPASQIRVPVWKYLHRLLAFTLFVRTEKGTKVIFEEMDVLVAMGRGSTVDTASILCHRLAEYAREKARNKTFGCVPFIFRLAQHYDLPLSDDSHIFRLDGDAMVSAKFLPHEKSIAWKFRSVVEPKALTKTIPALILRLEKLRRERARADDSSSESDDDAPPARASPPRSRRASPAPTELLPTAVVPFAPATFQFPPAASSSYQPPPAAEHDYHSDFGARLTSIEATQRDILASQQDILASQRIFESSQRHIHAQLAADRTSRRQMHSWLRGIHHRADAEHWVDPPPSPAYPDPFYWPGSSSTSADPPADDDA